MNSALEAFLYETQLAAEHLPITPFSVRQVSVNTLGDYPLRPDLSLSTIHDPTHATYIRIDDAPAGSDHDDDDDDDDEILRVFDPSKFRVWILGLLEQGVPPVHILADLGLKLPPNVFGDDVILEFIETMVLELAESQLPRRRLACLQTPAALAAQIKSARNIVFLVGAGISVSSGIPDFRGKNGIYTKLSKYNLKRPTDMFSLDFFRSNPIPFYLFCPEIFPCDDFKPSIVHVFLRLLETKGKLRRVYTQNIDCLEARAGISSSRLVNCHGSFKTFSCLDCGAKFPMEDLRDLVVTDRCIPICARCHHGTLHSSEQREELLKVITNSIPQPDNTLRRFAEARSRQNRAPQSALPLFPTNDPRVLKVPITALQEHISDGPITLQGIIKPQIIFFGEKLPSDLDEYIDDDGDVADLFIAIGSSLRVKPVSGILGRLPRTVPQVLINLESVGRPHHWDLELLGDCDIIIRYLLRDLGWWSDFVACATDLNLHFSRQESLLARQKVFGDQTTPWRYHIRHRIVDGAAGTIRQSN
ncbi:NAD-dependent histone deacetylase Sir2 [Giardia muris]|uniref:NAD-dependent histone deacetylase Sir2 n=1 Tax=Giardia muris TaxID=5742 RepID=A0A4Z1T7D3_GIAMU|nr:NAD-dependent histone deacetylase Sir2 [Giardia muris]|eukprot:TNJ29047.1 NAD-dependent histone deacetylase Sir2 [Giardia muris]